MGLLTSYLIFIALIFARSIVNTSYFLKKEGGDKNMTNRVMKNLAVGATGLAIAAGAVATGVAIADKKNRARLKRGVEKASKRIGQARDAFNQTKDKFQAYQHRIGLNNGKKKIKTLKSSRV